MGQGGSGTVVEWAIVMVSVVRDRDMACEKFGIIGVAK
jgi:hypothetical protein